MKRLLSRLRLRLSQRQDSEHGQQIVRIVLISLILAYVLLPAPRHDLPHGQYVGVLAIVLTGLSLSLLLFGWLLWRPARSDARRVLGMLADYGLIAAGMVQMGEPLAWVYIVVMWVTVGNGRTDNVIARNSSNINSIAENMTIDNAYAGIQLRYADATRGWVFT